MGLYDREVGVSLVLVILQPELKWEQQEQKIAWQRLDKGNLGLKHNYSVRIIIQLG